ncbi:hypothetical protein WA026_006965 [Henosepilachna vigintioctopunctata]|uniref:Uncharacterized protein n=1 Tax=Henosepilachna vigintioctopunctata TaxID=420089 RepID=A0AAW1VBC2_9CUCU
MPEHGWRSSHLFVPRRDQKRLDKTKKLHAQWHFLIGGRDSRSRYGVEQPSRRFLYVALATVCENAHKIYKSSERFRRNTRKNPSDNSTHDNDLLLQFLSRDKHSRGNNGAGRGLPANMKIRVALLAALDNETSNPLEWSVILDEGHAEYNRVKFYTQ